MDKNFLAVCRLEGKASRASMRADALDWRVKRLAGKLDYPHTEEEFQAAKKSSLECAVSYRDLSLEWARMVAVEERRKEEPPPKPSTALPTLDATGKGDEIPF